MSEGGRNHALALTVVAAIHLLAGAVLFRAPSTNDSSRAADPLRVRWVPRPPPQAPPSPPVAMPSPADGTPPRRPPSPSRRDEMPAHAPPPADAAPTPSPRAADYLAQGAAWATAGEASTGFAADPLRQRQAPLPGGEDGGRFRMRQPMSPQKALRLVGKLFGGSSYTTDPCPRLHDNVQGLLPDASDEGRRRLEWELREYRERCRP